MNTDASVDTAEAVISERSDFQARLTLNNPRSSNSLSIPLMRALRERLAEAGVDDSVKVIVIRANGKHFCSGGGLDWLQGLATGDQALWAAGVNELTALYTDLYRMDTPVIADVHGSVVGAGVGLTCLCDVVCASDASRWKLPEIALGMVPTLITPPLLNRVSSAAAHRLLFEDRSWSAEELRRFGLVTHVVKADARDAAANEMAAAYGQPDISVTRQTKRLIRSCRSEDFLAQMESVRALAMATLGDANVAQKIRSLIG